MYMAICLCCDCSIDGRELTIFITETNKFTYGEKTIGYNMYPLLGTLT